MERWDVEASVDVRSSGPTRIRACSTSPICIKLKFNHWNQKGDCRSAIHSIVASLVNIEKHKLKLEVRMEAG